MATVQQNVWITWLSSNVTSLALVISLSFANHRRLHKQPSWHLALENKTSDQLKMIQIFEAFYKTWNHLKSEARFFIPRAAKQKWVKLPSATSKYTYESEHLSVIRHLITSDGPVETRIGASLWAAKSRVPQPGFLACKFQVWMNIRSNIQSPVSSIWRHKELGYARVARRFQTIRHMPACWAASTSCHRMVRSLDPSNFA